MYNQNNLTKGTDAVANSNKFVTVFLISNGATSWDQPLATSVFFNINEVEKEMDEMTPSVSTARMESVTQIELPEDVIDVCDVFKSFVHR